MSASYTNEIDEAYASGYDRAWSEGCELAAGVRSRWKESDDKHLARIIALESESDALRVEIEFLRDALKPAVRPDVHALVTKERDTLQARVKVLETSTQARKTALEDALRNSTPTTSVGK